MIESIRDFIRTHAENGTEERYFWGLCDQIQETLEKQEVEIKRLNERIAEICNKYLD